MVEIDPAVTQVAHEELGLSPSTSVKPYNQDARMFLIDRPPGEKYDLVVGDAFNDASVPYHLTTLECNEQIKAIMTPNGFYIVNLIDNLREGRFVRSFMKTLERSFKHVYLVLGANTGTSTYVVMATNGNFSSDEFMRLLNAEEVDTKILVTLDDIEPSLGKGASVVLTDDYVPVDNMIAPLFAR